MIPPIEVERARFCRAEAGACESWVCLQVSPLLTIIAFSVGSSVHLLWNDSCKATLTAR